MTHHNSDRLGKLVLLVALRDANIETHKESQELLRLMTASETRDAVYDVCVGVAKDESERRKKLYEFMLMTLPGFPPSKMMLAKIDDLLKQSTPERNTEMKVASDLERLVKQQLSQVPFAHALNSAATFSKENAERKPNASYLDIHALQSLACKDDRDNLCAFRQPSEPKGGVAVVNSKSPQVDPKAALPLTCTDYVNQLPLECTRQTVEQQLDVLENLWDANPHNVDVVRATLFLAKQICDGYVSKVVFGSPYHLFRSVSVCYLPMLLKWMSSDYMYVRKNVYDFLLTLSLHLQLVDTAEKYPGCSEALQNELLWLLFNVLRRQALTLPYDQMTWSAAAKCTLAIVPRSYRHLIDVRALKECAQLPDLAERYPQAFSAFIESFSRSLLTDKRIGVRPCDNLVLDENEFAKLGSSALSDIFALYRRSTTVLARTSLFHVVFAYIVHVIRDNATDGKQMPSVSAVRDAYQALVQLDFPWYAHSLLLYQSHRTLEELHHTMAGHLQNTELHSCLATVSVIVRMLTKAIAEDAYLPSHLADVPTLDAIAAIPPLLKQNCDPRLYSMGWRLALYCTRRVRVSPRSADDATPDIMPQLVRCLVACSDAHNESDKALVRRLCPDLIGSLLVLARSNPAQVAETLPVLLEAYLFSPESRLSVSSLLTLYYHVLESLTMRNGPICEGGHGGSDVVDLLEQGLLVCPANAMRSVGSRVLWALYMGLRDDQTHSVCRARHVLVSLLTTFDQCTSLQIWKYVKMDLSPRVSRIGSEKVNALSKMSTRPV